MPRPATVPPQILAAWGLAPESLAAIEMGNINKTYVVTRGHDRFVLQWLNPIFGPEVHNDIEAVTGHLAKQGMLTPRLVRTRAGTLWSTDDEGGAWRLMTHIEGQILSAGATPEICREGGRLLGRFHRAVSSLTHEFNSRRPGVHDTARHVQHLVEVLRTHATHPAFAEVAPVGQTILARLGELAPLGDLPRRIVHGDPKLNNIVFSPQGQALCLIDLDTLGHMTIPVELGDALRSWCNPTGEDVAQAKVDLTLYAAAIQGYAADAKGFVTASERAAIPGAVPTIALELATRFCADALEECYFGWNRSAFASASAHNLHRAKSQLALGESLLAHQDEIERLTARAFA